MRHTRRHLIFLVGFGLPLLSLAGDADAQFAGALRGEYNLTVKRHCALAPTFDANFVPSAPGSDFDVVLRGTTTYDGVGGGTFAGEALAVFPPASTSTPTVSRATQTCTVTYTVNADGTVNQTLNCNLAFTVGGPPPAPGQTATLNGITLDGHLGLDGTVLLINDTSPSVETFTSTSGTSTGFTTQRVCNATGTATSRR